MDAYRDPRLWFLLPEGKRRIAEALRRLRELVKCHPTEASQAGQRVLERAEKAVAKRVLCHAPRVLLRLAVLRAARRALLKGEPPPPPPPGVNPVQWKRRAEACADLLREYEERRGDLASVSAEHAAVDCHVHEQLRQWDMWWSGFTPPPRADLLRRQWHEYDPDHVPLDRREPARQVGVEYARLLRGGRESHRSRNQLWEIVTLLLATECPEVTANSLGLPEKFDARDLLLDPEDKEYDLGEEEHGSVLRNVIRVSAWRAMPFPRVSERTDLSGTGEIAEYALGSLLTKPAVDSGRSTDQSVSSAPSEDPPQNTALVVATEDIRDAAIPDRIQEISTDETRVEWSFRHGKGAWFVGDPEDEQAIYGDLLGLRFIHHLLLHPYKKLSTVELENAIGRPAEPVTSPQPVSDKEALKSYREEAVRVTQQLAEARELHKNDEVERLLEKIRKLQVQVNSATGRRGHLRAMGSGGSGQKSRSRVGHAILSALNRLAEPLPEVHAHLKESIDTPSGQEPQYVPNSPVYWLL